MSSLTPGRDESRPPSSAEAQSVDLGTLIVGVVNAVSRSLRAELEPDGLHPLDFALLRALQESGTSTATQLAHLLPVEQSRVSRLVDGLVQKGLLRRRRLRSDRRVVSLELTDQGKELASDLRRRVEARYARLLAGSSPEDVQRFVDTAYRIMANNRADAEDAQ